MSDYALKLARHLPGLRQRLRSLYRVPHWKVGSTGFILWVALLNAALYHGPLYSFAWSSLDVSSFSGARTLFTLFFLGTYVSAQILALLALVSERLLKPVCMLAALGNAIALYFVRSYGVILDRAMMGNVFNTDAAETADLLHPRILLYVLLLGVLPCWLLFRVQLRPTPLPRRLGFALGVFVVGLGWAYANASTWLWIDENAKRLGGMTLPWSYAINGPRYLATQVERGEPTPLPAATFESNEKAVVILVIGEAARALNFSLYGYPRPTNPLLSAAGVSALAETRSCSTYTTASLRCILSPVDSGWKMSDASEPLPSYLQRQGIDVIWRSDNWGEPPLKVRTLQRAGELRKTCTGAVCDYDEVLLQGLEPRIRASGSDRVFVVLHQSGSHGPAYYSKYPARFERFTPVCKSVELHRCTGQELVNAYDNTIVYTDYFLQQAIAVLQAFPDRPTALVYISDHGESLGEFGLYLHGTPYSIAPDVQKDIPFLVWMSDSFRAGKGIPPGPLAQAGSHSQANVFHSVMGAFDMRGPVYQANFDIFNVAAANAASANR